MIYHPHIHVQVAHIHVPRKKVVHHLTYAGSFMLIGDGLVRTLVWAFGEVGPLSAVHHLATMIGPQGGMLVGVAAILDGMVKVCNKQ